MKFTSIAALAALLLVVAPLAAHLLRLRRPKARTFAPARLVAAAPPNARSRSRLEDRWLLTLRMIAVAALALLGATPLVQCSRLALGRTSGGSVAVLIVIDDSSSMRVRTTAGKTRFDVAKRGAMDLVSGVREGDTVGVVLAGEPVRIGLVPTSDASAMTAAIDAMAVSDRATDLDGAVAMARNMARGLPQSDRRVVVLSDLADGRFDAPALGEGAEGPLWIPQEGLEGHAENCAILGAERADRRVVARVSCSGAGASRGRQVEVRAKGVKLASRALPAVEGDRVATAEVAIDLPDGSPIPEEAALVGSDDAIGSDDHAPVAPPVRGASLAVVSDLATSQVATGGPPAVEQALAALELGVSVRALPAVPDTSEEIAPFAGMLIDDPPGLTPESREVVRKWLESGAVGLVALGPRSAAAPLGASLEPFVAGGVRWENRAPAGVDPKTSATLGMSADSLADLRATGRALLEATAVQDSEAIIRWSDGAPWLVRRTVGRGTAFALSLPMNPETSDLVLRPGFLALLANVVDAAGARGGSRRVEAGTAWFFPKESTVEVAASFGVVQAGESDGRRRVVPAVAGRYDLRIDGLVESRFASIPEREIDLRRRRVAAAAMAPGGGATTAWIDLSHYVAFALLGLLAAEMVVRLLLSVREPHGSRV